jgi:hypothetical protein
MGCQIGPLIHCMIDCMIAARTNRSVVEVKSVMQGNVGKSLKIGRVIWRRGRDSNPRYRC